MSSGELLKYEEFLLQSREKFGPRTVVFYQSGDFYEIYNFDLMDFHEVCTVLELKKTQKLGLGELTRKNYQMAGFPLSGLYEYTEKAIKSLYTVVVVDQIAKYKPIKREIVDVIGPGIGINAKKTFLTIYFKEYKGKYEKNLAAGIVLSDVSTGSCVCFDFSKNVTDNITKLIDFHLPHQIIVASVDALSTDVMKKCFLRPQDYISGLSLIKNRLSNIPVSWTTESFQNTLFEKVYNKKTFEISELSKIALVMALEEINKYDPRLIISPSLPKKQVKNGMMISTQTYCHLDLVNISELVCKPITAPTKRFYSNLLESPMIDPTLIQKSYDIIDYFREMPNTTTDAIVNLLKSTFDIDNLIWKMKIGKSTVKDIERLHQTTKIAKDILGLMKNNPKSSFHDIKTDLEVIENQNYSIDSFPKNESYELSIKTKKEVYQKFCPIMEKCPSASLEVKPYECFISIPKNTDTSCFGLKNLKSVPLRKNSRKDYE